MTHRIAAALLILGLASSASAQMQDTEQWMRGHMDSPAQNDSFNLFGRTVIRQGAVTLSGWAVDCYTLQQPTRVQVYYQDAPDAAGQRHVVLAPDTQVSVHWRLERQDVNAWLRTVPVMNRSCGSDTPFWGYAVQILTPLPLGPNSLALVFVDPLVGIGTNVQQALVEIVP